MSYLNFKDLVTLEEEIKANLITEVIWQAYLDCNLYETIQFIFFDSEFGLKFID